MTGWKEIANYLGKGVRTVQRYERDLGLPIRRPARRNHGSVLATTAELDAWVNASPIRETYQLSRRMPDSSANTAQALKRGVERMTLLRDQMAALRLELHNSLEMLNQTVFSLWGGLNLHSWPEAKYDASAGGAELEDESLIWSARM